MKRLRGWREAEDIPLVVDSVESTFRLSALRECDILIHNQTQIRSQDSFRIKKLQDLFGTEFSLKSAANALGLERRTMSDLLKKAMDDGVVIRIGKGPTTMYRFVRSQDDIVKLAG